MSLGSAGCKYYADGPYCPHHDESFGSPYCMKFGVPLKTHEHLKESIRAKGCTDGAQREAESITTKRDRKYYENRRRLI